MERFIFYLAYFFTTGAGIVIAQSDKQYQVPDFAEIPAENRWDSIEQWYINHIDETQTKTGLSTEQKSRLMNDAKAYADRSDDATTQTAMTFFRGHFDAAMGDSIGGMRYMLEARDMAEKYELKHIWACITFDLGNRFFAGNPAMGLEYMLRGYEMMKRIGITENEAILVKIYILGTFQFYLANYGGCIETLMPVLETWQKRKALKLYVIQANNTIGLAYKETGRNDSALFYFRKVLALAKTPPLNPAFIGIAAGNIGSIHIRQHLWDSALIYAKLNYDYVKNDPNVSGAGVAEALILLSTVDIELHQPDLVIDRLFQAEKLIEGRQLYFTYNVKPLMLKVYYILARAYKERGDYRKGNIYLQRALALQEELSYKKNADAYTMVQGQVEAEKSMNKLKETEDEIRLSVQRRNFLIAGFCFIGLILFNLYKRQQLKRKKNKALLDNREQLLFLEKKRAEENLAGYMKTLEEKNKLIEYIEEEIVTMNEAGYSSENSEMLEAFNKLKNFTILTNDDWVEFRSLFEKVHKGFFTRLKEKFPDITPSEMRIMALMKLDVPLQKMANMLGVASKSIRKTQYRFLKKIDTTSIADLLDIVNSL